MLGVFRRGLGEMEMGQRCCGAGADGKLGRGILVSQSRFGCPLRREKVMMVESKGENW